MHILLKTISHKNKRFGPDKIQKCVVIIITGSIKKIQKSTHEFSIYIKKKENFLEVFMFLLSVFAINIAL